MINLTTLEQVRRLLNEPDAEFNNDLTNRIAEVSFRVQSVYSIDLEQQTYTEIKDGGGKRLYVDNPPIVSVTSVTLSNDLQFAGGEIVAPTEYAVVNRGWDIEHQTCWAAGSSGVQVIYIGGYTDPTTDPASTLPGAIQEAVARQVAYEFEQRKTIGLTNVDFPDGAITKETDGFLKSVKMVLNTLRKIKIG
jgi:hypothetical protein